MHWTYAEQLDAKNLKQGDVLRRTPALNDLLKEVHPYFHDRDDNLFFMVLTQSCDLVQRPNAKAEYIAICPVRPLRRIIDRILKPHVQVSAAGIPVGSARDRQRFEDVLRRLMNNNEPGYFYLYRDEMFGEDLCALTRLSISIRTGEHYDKCLAAKTIELAEPFRAKLGWAIGNIYGRIGTKDWDKNQLSQRLEEAMSSSIVWVGDEKQRERMISDIDAMHAAGRDIDDRAISDIKRDWVSTKDQLVRLVRELMERAGVDELAREKVERKLKSDPALGKLIKA